MRICPDVRRTPRRSPGTGLRVDASPTPGRSKATTSRRASKGWWSWALARSRSPPLCKWERGAVRSLDEESARAISRYGEESGLDIATQLERALTNEPMLSERQTRLVDGLATRLMQDPMTDAEVRLAQTLLRSVGLGV